MKTIFHRVGLLVFTLFLFSPCGIDQILPRAVPETVGFSSERLGRIEEAMQSYVDQGKIAGTVTFVARQGKIAHLEATGLMDREASKPMKTDTIFRIASMTKPITSLAVMMLYEEGKFLLNDPVSKYIPEFKDSKVLVPTGATEPYTLYSAENEITIHHLLSHTSGLTYGFFGRKYFTDLYKEAGVSDGLTQTEGTIGEGVKRLAKLPLVHQPGKKAEYSLSTDVLGYLVEVVSGMPLDQFFKERIFEPLGMRDTYFFLPDNKVDRLAAVYTPNDDGEIDRLPEEKIEMGPVVFSTSYHYKGPKTYFSGGAGLVSTAPDYARFLQMMLNNGELNGVRLVSRKTVELMTMDHLGDLEMFFFPGGYTFGLGFGICTDPAAVGTLGSVGEYNWGGFFYTQFWIDPSEDMIGLIMTQLYPSGGLDLQEKFRVLVYQAIDD